MNYLRLYICDLCPITRNIILAFAMAVLAGCGVSPVYWLVAITNPRGNDHCRDDRRTHLVFATLRGCPPPSIDEVTQYEPVTQKNANDHVFGKCLLRQSVSFANLKIFNSLLRNGAKKELCSPGFDDSDFSALIRYPQMLAGTDPSIMMGRLEEIDIRPSSVQFLLTEACQYGSISAAKYAISKGAEPEKLAYCRRLKIKVPDNGAIQYEYVY